MRPNVVSSGLCCQLSLSFGHPSPHPSATMPNSSSALSAVSADSLSRSDMESCWLPFTPNRQFKAKPRLLAKASGMHYWTPEGRKILDGVAGLWCVNAGHGREEITSAVAKQLQTMDYGPSFQ